MTDPSYLAAVRESYDTVADDYAALVKPPSALDPLSRSMLSAFAELVRAADRGPVADVGCGPGKVTAHLAGLGVSAFGIDVSPKMVELARTAYPELRFSVGSMTALEIEDDALGGILAYYSTHHTPPESLPVVFSEFHRTLAPGGHLLLVGHVGAGEHRRPGRAYGGHSVSFASYRLPVEQLARLLKHAGFSIDAQLAQEPGEDLRWKLAHFLTHKPTAEESGVAP
ncbi:class I SAM-dependent methyltransferase [Streptomyces tirandamycinicus]|uniref:SAM-dependent methyltransferase n=1 Tax=Streptomyces tirandamycinicus TaxID=2174846 RepID=A0A2S1SSP9_9ACTN|nr:class I SAM-dependent methyltransferase [Streptomyces tirandamycinicus]AWI29436.1 SAM-dependent methyltransferase [Streptomyces tirandamycinicus]